MRTLAAAIAVAVGALGISLSAVAPASASAGGSSLSAGQELQAGQDLVSPGGQYTLDMQTDGNLVVYGNGCVIWNSNTGGSGSHNFLAMQADGNLVIYTSAGKPVWNSKTAGTGSQNTLEMQVDGNLVVYASGSKPVWASGASSASQLCAPGSMSAGKYLHSPSGQYKLNMQSDGNLVIYDNGSPTWASGTAGTGSANFVAMQADGNLVIYTSGGKALWASRTSGSGSHNFLAMQNDGNLVVYTSGGKALWASKTAGSGLIGSGGSEPAGNSAGNAIVNAAAAEHNASYCWDGGSTTGPTHGDGNKDGATKCGSASIKGFDCTGLALYAVYQATHIVLPHGLGIENVKGGTRITSEADLQPGDIILFGGTWTNYEHVGIYAGSGKMWDANVGYAPYPNGVQERTLAWETSGSGGLNFIGAVRF